MYDDKQIGRSERRNGGRVHLVTDNGDADDHPAYVKSSYVFRLELMKSVSWSIL